MPCTERNSGISEYLNQIRTESQGVYGGIDTMPVLLLHAAASESLRLTKQRQNTYPPIITTTTTAIIRATARVVSDKIAGD